LVCIREPAAAASLPERHKLVPQDGMNASRFVVPSLARDGFPRPFKCRLQSAKCRVGIMGSMRNMENNKDEMRTAFMNKQPSRPPFHASLLFSVFGLDCSFRMKRPRLGRFGEIGATHGFRPGSGLLFSRIGFRRPVFAKTNSGKEKRYILCA